MDIADTWIADDALDGDFDLVERRKAQPRRDDGGPKRKYNRTQARETRARRSAMREQGIDPGSHYQPRNGTKRKWVASGKFVGATLKKGGKLRNFKDLNKYRREPSKFLTSERCDKKKKKDFVDDIVSTFFHVDPSKVVQI